MPIDVFLAYGGKSEISAQTMKRLPSSLDGRGLKAFSWEALNIGGRIIVDAILEKIDEAQCVVAEVGSMNLNVLFEAGYAVAKAKQLILSLDNTTSGPGDLWQTVGMFATLGRVDHGNDVEKFANKIASEFNPEAGEHLLSSLLADAQRRDEDAIFTPSAPHSLAALSNLDNYLGRQGDLNLLCRGDDLTLAPLTYYAGCVYRSSAVLIPLLAGDDPVSLAHNARSSFLAGFAVGQALPTLILAPKDFTAPLDYKDRLYSYKSPADLQNKVDEWLRHLPRNSASGRRPGTLRVDIEMPISSFGRYVAEEELNELGNYYVPTMQFSHVTNGGNSLLFLGRKGTGKSAAMEQARAELSRNRNVMTVTLKPASYEMQGLVSAASRVEYGDSVAYLNIALWRFLLLTEIAIATIRSIDNSPRRQDLFDEVDAIRSLLRIMEVDDESDFLSRMESIVSKLDRIDPKLNFHQELNSVLETGRLNRLRDLVKTALAGFDRIALLVDNLDKAWENDSDFDQVSHFISALLECCRELENAFLRSTAASPQIEFAATIFLRQDIFDAMKGRVAEPDKLPVESIQWRDGQLLSRVLEERYDARKRGGRERPGSLWKELFPAEVHGLPARDYFLWRSLPRPRDFIMLANSSIGNAINRRHSSITQDDILSAERDYSKFATDALIVESMSEGVPLSTAVLEMAGLDATLSKDDLDVMMSPFDDPEKMIMWLVRSSFLGVETSRGVFEHIEGEEEARRHINMARRLAVREDRRERFRIHPAFRPHLRVRDDDLHDSSVVDGTLI